MGWKAEGCGINPFETCYLPPKKRQNVWTKHMIIVLVMLVWYVGLDVVSAEQIVLKDDFSDDCLTSDPVWEGHPAVAGYNRFVVVDDQGRKAIRTLEEGSSAGSLFRLPASFGEPVVLDTKQGPISAKFEMRFGSPENGGNYAVVYLIGPEGHFINFGFIQRGRIKIILPLESKDRVREEFVSPIDYYYSPERYYSCELICREDGSFEVLVDGQSAIRAVPKAPISLFETLVFYEPGAEGKTHFFSNVVVTGEPKEEKVSYFQPGQSPLLTVPRASSPPKVDGWIEKEEWQSASAVSGFFDLVGTLSDRQTIVYASFDEENLYLAFYSLHQGKFREGKAGRDIKFGSEMEAIEIWLEPPGKGWFQFLGVPAGGTLINSSSKEPIAWNGGWKFKNKVEDSGETISGVLSFDKKIWTAEVSISFKDLGVSPPRDGEMWRMNFCRDFSTENGYSPQNATSWSFTHGVFANPEKFGFVLFDRKAVGFQLTQFGDPGGGNIAIKGNATGIQAGTIAIEMAVKTRDEKGKIILKRLENLGISPGKSAEFSIPARLQVSNRTEANLLVAAYDLFRQKILAQAEIPFTCLSSFRLESVLNYNQGLLYVEIDVERVANLPEKFSGKIEVYAEGEASARLSTLVKELGPERLKGKVNLNISGLKPGEYLVKGIVQDAVGKILASSSGPFTIPERPGWLGNQIGVSEEVLPPWFPVKVEGNCVKVTEREYVLDNSGLPISIKSLGEELLAGPAVLKAVIEKKEVSWDFKPLKKLEEGPQQVTWEFAGSGGPLTLKGKLRIEFDGFALWEVQIASKGPTALDSLVLEFPFKRNRALYARGWTGFPTMRACSASLYKDVFTQDPSREPEEIIGYAPWRYSRKGWIWNSSQAAVFLAKIAWSALPNQMRL